jgi:hypothetical protein
MPDPVAESGQRSGGWARVVSFSTHESVRITALLAIAAAQSGDPLAADLEAYVLDAQIRRQSTRSRRSRTRRALGRLPRETARVAYTVAKRAARVELAPGRGISLELTPAHGATASFASIDGAASAACAWDAPADVAGTPVDPFVRIERKSLSGRCRPARS